MMIDEKKLLEELNNFQLPVEEDTPNMALTIFGVIKNRIKEIVENQPKVGKWILCKDSLPEEVGNYIIHAKTGTDEDYVGMWLYERGAHLSGEQTYIDDKQGYWANAWSGDPISEGMSRNCVAWQPLPEVYNG